ncbi:flagellar export chaperone FlgN [Rhodopirellula sp. P2]|uniref:flagellar export chaperone FlgN n=1 Tax=Rhodopirellula sp. P2 TaxID=2127060 RepID=UPI002368110D|nr:flagellar export chaperone FlgN [Rhodopirellula sp. P2]WDQ14828.1 flagellar export chaperone FlgN [Rhodopirellula sp. P2]
MEATIDRRFALLELLLELTVQQEAAISEGHMNELMRVLSQKQRAVEQLVQASEQLKNERTERGDSPPVSDEHRQRNAKCDEMHRELMAREQASEKMLSDNRDDVASQLQQNDGAKRAAKGYDQTNRGASSGGSTLDLSQ